MPPPSPGRREQLTERYNAAWLAPLVAWIGGVWRPVPGARLIDLGCGDLQLAELLPETVRLDGVEPDGRARAAAERRAGRMDRMGRPASVVADLDELPATGYLGAIASSVLQYVEDERAVVALLGRVLAHLAEDHAGIVATDLVAPPRRPVVEAVDAWRTARRSVGVVAAPIVLGAAAVRNPRRLLALSPEAVVRIADELELRATPLENLSPFSTRATWLLTRPDDPRWRADQQRRAAGGPGGLRRARC